MTIRNTSLDPEKRARMLAELHRDIEQRQKSYRGRAFELFPHICGRCGREFSGRRLNELTVHHKDLNHDNNPPDGSNWELLCIYCHDDEHTVASMKGPDSASSNANGRGPSPISSPFEGLDDLLKKEGEK